MLKIMAAFFIGYELYKISHIKEEKKHRETILKFKKMNSQQIQEYMETSPDAKELWRYNIVNIIYTIFNLILLYTEYHLIGLGILVLSYATAYSMKSDSKNNNIWMSLDVSLTICFLLIMLLFY